jgi:hypothetical protein
MKLIKALKIAALIFPGLTVAILLVFGLGEMIGGDWTGLGHLAQAIPIVLFLWLGWRRPLWGGIFLLVLSVLAFQSLFFVLSGPDWLAPFLIVIVPLFLSGVLMLGAFGLERKAA